MSGFDTAATIDYDRPVKDLIAELSATGHVTHRRYKKKSVTLHHNAGRLSHEGVLRVWQTRPASAHFDVDSKGDVAQYVNAFEYAWAAGSTTGNIESIHIEMCNSSLAPDWGVSETTWKSAARLAGFLFAKFIGERPSNDNFFVHSHWYGTLCAGPSIKKVWLQILSEAQSSYDHFKANPSAPAPAKPAAPAPAPAPAPARKSNDAIANEVIANKWGNGQDRVNRLTRAGYNAAAIQSLVNQKLNVTKPAPKSDAAIAAEVWAGKWGTGQDRLSRLTRAGYNANRIQALVNNGVGRPGQARVTSGRKTVDQLAVEVIQGKWGNGDARMRQLAAAGYDAKAVQARVNRRLG